MNCAKNIVNAKEVYEKGYCGLGVRIAVLDTGVSMHADLKGKIVYFCDLVNHRSDIYDDNGHGTHIAGILCGLGAGNIDGISGMSPGAELVVFKVLDQRGNGKTEDVITALCWVKENFSKYRIRLLNFSMGFLPHSGHGEQRKIMCLLEELWDLGITIVTAAGNNGPRKYSITVPGVSRKVITVGALDDDRIENRMKKGYSGKGPTDCCIVKPEILAPGTDVISLNRTDGYIRKSGSSMATPIVCGALALGYEKNPKITPAKFKLVLYETANREYKKDYGNSWGILNVDRLIESI